MAVTSLLQDLVALDCALSILAGRNHRKDFARSAGDETFGDFEADLLRIVGARKCPVGDREDDVLRPVQARHRTRQRKRAGVRAAAALSTRRKGRVDADGNRATALELAQARPLGLCPPLGRPVADLPDELFGLLVISPRLNTERTLTDGIVNLWRRDERRRPVTEVDALQTGVSEDECRVRRRRCIKLGQPRIPAEARARRDTKENQQWDPPT